MGFVAFLISVAVVHLFQLHFLRYFNFVNYVHQSKSIGDYLLIGNIQFLINMFHLLTNNDVVIY